MNEARRKKKDLTQSHKLIVTLKIYSRISEGQKKYDIALTVLIL